MGIMRKAVMALQSGLVSTGNSLIEAGLKFSRPETISAFMGAVDGRVMRNQSGDRIVVSPKTLRRLAMYDPITGAIIKKYKSRISKMQWSVGPDCQKAVEDLHRLEKLAAGWLSPYKPTGWTPSFTSEVLPPEMVKWLWGNLKNLSPKEPKSRQKARWLFDQAETDLQSQKAGPAFMAEDFLKNINKDNRAPFKFTLERWIDDLCILDAGAGPLVRSRDGGILEAYAIPGDEVVRYVNPDLSTPQPPYRAFRWERNGTFVADYTVDDMLYMVKNPQPNGYGFSPVELAVNIITASLYADTFNIDSFRDNIPASIMNLGPVTDAQRVRFRAEWENELHRGGKHRIMFINAPDGGKPEFIPMVGNTQRDMEYSKYLKWTLSIKCMCFGMSPQDVGFVEDFHRTTAETQQGISTEGTLDMADFLEQSLTESLVKPFFGKDLRFGFIRDQQVMSAEQAKVHATYLEKGILSPNQVLGMIGQRPLPEGGDQPFIITKSGVVPLAEIFVQDGAIELRADADASGAEDGTLDAAPSDKPVDPKAEKDVEKALNSLRGPGHRSLDEIRESVRVAKDNRKGRTDRFKARLQSEAQRVKEAVQAGMKKK